LTGSVSASPFDHPFLSGLLGDEEVATCFSAPADIDAMVAFEIALAVAEAAEGLLPAEAGRAIGEALADFRPDMEHLRTGTARDGVVVPALVQQLRGAIGEPHGVHVHFGATSQDVIDTSLAIRLTSAMVIIEKRINSLIDALDALEARDGALQVMAHTRMQAALPVPAARKIASWREPLRRGLDRVPHVPGLALWGAVGTREKFGDKGEAVARRVAAALGLQLSSGPLHSERDGQARLASWLSLVTGALGKMGQDIALMAQSEVGEVRLASGGGSSAMPHKVNPVGAEVLVTLARFNATLVSGMHQALVHENERSGAAWTLEWMLLPQMVLALAASLRTAKDLFESLSFARP